MTRMTDYQVFETTSGRNKRLHREERLILETTLALVDAMQLQGITKTELARRLGKSKGFVTQVLAGGRNLTLRTIADIVDALDCTISLEISGRATQGAAIDSEFATVERKVLPLSLARAGFRDIRHVPRKPITRESVPTEGAA